ncbi:hypothetical protein BBH99_19860 [Chryseobacterium contaminans]|uniref:Glucosyl transferase GtrII n=1 Tax=Chryseobacterium contaminans TaxID=1423959 RepID=A0A1M7A3T8_9FLAO|nr:hypothetical protein [Chryseobacterium contaminans]OCA79037.1 hypothetical protein BBH99_19860 [Chryseobacterium contaminans]SHL37377.1 hypothetical protein SAMN05444407_103476 [Chryseobacterium contaminans]
MEKQLNNTYLVFLNILIVVYNLYIWFSVFTEKAIVADDLKEAYNARHISEPYFSYIYSYLDSSNMAARPVSGFITGTLVFLSKYNDSIYLLGILFFPLSLFAVYWVTQKILSKELASLITLLYSCSVIGTSIQFSPIMLNSNLATIFFSLSIYSVYTRKNILISALFFILSILSYEIFLPLILLNLFLIKDNKKRFVFLLLTVGSVVIFRKVIQPAIFVHSYQRDEVGKILELKRVIQVTILTVKLFFKDIFVGIHKGLLNLKNLHILEILLALIMSSVVYKVFSGYDFKNKLKHIKNVGWISLVSIILAISVFYVSAYIPTLFGFDNRSLGAIRLFYTLFIISGVIYCAFKLNLGNKTISATFAGIAFLLLTTNISVKNAWIYASRFNYKMFHELSKTLKAENITSGVVCLRYDMFTELKTNPHFILREPIFYNNWECRMLSEINGIDVKKVWVFNADRQTKCEMVFLYKNGKIVREK